MTMITIHPSRLNVYVIPEDVELVVTDRPLRVHNTGIGQEKDRTVLDQQDRSEKRQLDQQPEKAVGI